ncbi:MAG: wax ester/triacylglycerol synthase domain-containing protein, partial [Streptosporangiales bacterium]
MPPDPAVVSLVHRCWPGSEVTCALRRPSSAAAGYPQLWRHHRTAAALRGLVGGATGRRLRGVLNRFDPDLVVCTSGSAVAAARWLRRHRGLTATLVQVDPALAVDPLAGGLDGRVLADPVASSLVSVIDPAEEPVVPADAPVAAEARNGAAGPVGAGNGRGPAGTPRRPRTVLVGGRWPRAVRATLEAEIRAMGGDLTESLGEAGLVVADGRTPLAVWAAMRGLPVIVYSPRSARARLEAALLQVSGRAETCHSLPLLRSAVAGAMARQGTAFDDAAVRALGAAPPRTAVGGTARLRRQDALFVHTQSTAVTQQLGTVLVLESPEAPPTIEAVRSLIAERIPPVLALRRRLRGSGRWRTPVWAPGPVPDVHTHVQDRVVPDEDAAWRVVDEFWSTPVSQEGPPWTMLLVHGFDEHRSLFVMKMHHAIGDGLSALGTLDRLLDPASDPPRHRSFGHGYGMGKLRQAALVARGLAHLAAAGGAPRTRIVGPNDGFGRSFAAAVFPAERLGRAARALGVRRSELVFTAAAEALSRIDAGTPDRVRVMVPVSMRPLSESRTAGNWTGAMRVDLPTGPMALPERLTRVREVLGNAVRQGQPAAATVAIRLMGVLPTPLYAHAARLSYSSRFFNMVLSYVPGPKAQRSIAGARLAAVFPAMGLAEGVRLAVGVTTWGGTTGIGVLSDAGVAADGRA